MHSSIAKILQTYAKPLPSSIALASLLLASSSWCAVDLDQFTPGTNLIGYSVYTTDSVYLPSGSGLANGGLFGSGGGIVLNDGMKLRAPKITVGRGFTLGSNSDSLPKTVVGGDATIGNNTKVFDTLQVGGNLSASSNNLAFNAPVAVKGNLALSGNQLTDSSLLRLGGTYTSANLTFSAAAQVRMAAASGGPSILATQITYNVPYVPLLTAPLAVVGASLPASTITGYNPPGSLPNVDLSGPANSATDSAIQFLSPTATTAYYWHCSTSGLPVGACHGDTLLPGYYGALTLTGNRRALLLTEGFYSFTSIALGGGNALIAGQPQGGRTIVYSENDITANSSHAFIGPDGARLATGFGSDSTKFLGGTMMLATGKNMVIPNDNRIWATLSAPAGDINLSSQVALFGQAYAKRLIGANLVDFGQGAFIPFKGTVPALTGPDFRVGERTDTSCHDFSGRPCRDTLITLRIPAVTAYQGSVHYEIKESATRSAIAGIDFSADTGTLIIPINALTTLLRVRIFDDSSYEGPETFRVVLSKPVAVGFAKVAGGSADTSVKTLEFTGTIIDNDSASIVKITSDSAVMEGNSGTHPSTFTVRLYDPYHPDIALSIKNAPQLPVAFRWHTVDGSATVSDSDYLAQLSRWDTVPALALTKSISVLVKGDLRYENDEAFKVIIDSVVNGTLSGASTSDSGVIRNDDSAPTIRISGITVQEPAVYGDTAWATFTFHVSAPSGLATPIFWRTQDGSAKGTADFAKNPADYLTNSGTLVIPHDSLSGTVRVAVFGDTLFEKSEIFTLMVDSVKNGFIGDTTATATILDADSAPTVSISSATIREPSTGTSILRFPVHLSRPSGIASSFVWSTQDGTALQGLDYKAVVSDTMHLPAFLRDTVLQVVIYSDSVAGEGDETFSVTLSDLTDLRPGSLAAVGTIQDAQDGFRLTIDSIAPVAEADTLVHFQARLDWVPATDIRVVFHLQPGTAHAGERYADTSGTVIFTAGSRTAAFAVRLTTDSLWEPLEYFTLRLDSILGSRTPVATDSFARAWIHERASLTVAYASPDDTVREDTAGTVSVKIILSQPTSFPFKVRVPLLPGSTASFPSDFTYQGTSGDTVVVPAGNRTWSFGVKVTADTIQENDEIVSLGLVPVDSGTTGNPDSWNLTILDDDHLLKPEIQTPPDGLHTKDTAQHITWTVDGKPQPSKDTTFTTPGWNCVERSVTDRFGRVFTTRNCIWLDLTAPVVRVFKITGRNPHDRNQDTTWWGDLAKTRYGKDTVWYEVRDSIQDSSGKSWHVLVDTLFALTDFQVDGLHPTRVEACDSVGNCAFDTGWIDLKMALPQAVSGVYLDRDGDGRIDALIVNLSGVWNADFLPTFDAPLPPEIRHNLKVDSLMPYVTQDGIKDYSRFLVPIADPFRYGATGFASLSGVMWETWTTGKANADPFPIRDSVPPVITQATVVRAENYQDPDTLRFTPSEPIAVTGKAWLEVGRCRNDSATCPDSMLVWHVVPADSVHAMPDGSWWILVQAAKPGSIKPGYRLRLLPSASDTLGNHVDSLKRNWNTLVVGPPRRPILEVTGPVKIPEIDATELGRKGPGGILLQATSGDTTNMGWWDPSRGYLSESDPAVQSICPNGGRTCNGPSVYVNNPMTLIVYIYDHQGTFAMSTTVRITQADIDALKRDKLDRIKLSLQWNHRTESGVMVASGIYHWRVVSFLDLPGSRTAEFHNQILNLGVKVLR
jgi:Calx-beta domain